MLNDAAACSFMGGVYGEFGDAMCACVLQAVLDAFILAHHDVSAVQ